MSRNFIASKSNNAISNSILSASTPSELSDNQPHRKNNNHIQHHVLPPATVATSSPVLNQNANFINKSSKRIESAEAKLPNTNSRDNPILAGANQLRASRRDQFEGNLGQLSNQRAPSLRSTNQRPVLLHCASVESPPRATDRNPSIKLGLAENSNSSCDSNSYSPSASVAQL